MASCLGLYIEENLIKYAKVSKERDSVKVESFGIKFYDKIDEAIKQIVQETYSQKTPISVNLSEEMYNYFDMFSLLTKNDLQKAIKTEFEAFCAEKNYNPNVFESRYAIVDNQIQKEKIKVIHIADNKIELNKRLQQLEGYKCSNISPIGMSVPSIVDADRSNNAIIVNIEDKTTITTILNKQISDVQVFDEGCRDILSRINIKENSYSKAYEICKNTTIYTSEGKDLQEEETTYLEDIMPTLFDIVGQVRKVINSNTEKIEKIYITGTGALINNVDLYFQEYLSETDCEILKPYFVESTKELSIKDYIEVNSAIALGMMGVGEGIEGMNFKKQSLGDRLPEWMKIDLGSSKVGDEKKNSGGLLTWDIGQQLDKVEINLIRVAVTLFMLVIVYSTFTALLSKQMEEKKQDTQAVIDEINEQIAKANEDSDGIKKKINEYQNIVNNLKEANDVLAERNQTRNSIPNLLNQIMTIIPENVNLTSIENTTGRHIVIKAQSSKYDQLGYFIARLKTDVILTGVISTSGQKDGESVMVEIEGDLP